MRSPANATARAAAHAGLPARWRRGRVRGRRGTVYNTRFNRDSSTRRPEAASEASRTRSRPTRSPRAPRPGRSTQSEQAQLRDELVACALAAFYAPHNRELLEVLDAIGQGADGVGAERRRRERRSVPVPAQHRQAQLRAARAAQLARSAHARRALGVPRGARSTSATTPKVAWLPASPAPPAGYALARRPARLLITSRSVRVVSCWLSREAGECEVAPTIQGGTEQACDV